MTSWLDEIADRLGAQPVRGIAEGSGLRRAAVLVPLFVKEGEIWILLTRRAGTMALHAGQYAFPGGVCDSSDEDEVATALREAHEELGIDPDAVLIIGHLDQEITTTGFVISPVVGAVPFPTPLVPNPEEVGEVVELPLLFVANPIAVEEEELLIEGEPMLSPILHYSGHRITGATARILIDLLDRLGLAPQQD